MDVHANTIRLARISPLRAIWRRWEQASASPFAATRRRLVAINLLVVSAILVVMATAVYVTDAHAIDQQIDQQLTNWAQHETVHVSNSSSISPPDHDLQESESYQPGSPNLFTIAFDTHGKVLFDPGNARSFGLPDLASANPVLSGHVQQMLVTISYKTHDFRLYTLGVSSNGHMLGALQAGSSLDARDRQLHDLLVTLALVGIGALILTGLAGVWLADRALEPARLAFARQHQFAAAASHELRTPLAFVRSQAELVTRRVKRSPAATATGVGDDVTEIITEVDYMTRLVSDLLLLARDANDPQIVLRHTVDLVAIACDAVTRLAPAATAQGITLVTEIAPEQSAANVLGDADRLRQLAIILIDNAIRYTPTGGTVRVGITTAGGPRVLAGHGGHAILTVSDTGVGIAADDLPRIFEPFYRADPARTNTETHSGTGLGLALARWLVTAHNGDIAVTSQLDEGSTFTVTLPLISRD